MSSVVVPSCRTLICVIVTESSVVLNTSFSMGTLVVPWVADDGASEAPFTLSSSGRSAMVNRLETLGKFEFRTRRPALMPTKLGPFSRAPKVLPTLAVVATLTPTKTRRLVINVTAAFWR